MKERSRWRAEKDVPGETPLTAVSFHLELQKLLGGIQKPDKDKRYKIEKDENVGSASLEDLAKAAATLVSGGAK